MITLEIDPTFTELVDAHNLKQTVIAVLEKLSDPGAELTLVIADDSQISALNRDYRDIDMPTDVLSFPADFIDPESDTPYLGDIIISYPRAEAQAAESGHTPQAELQLLAVHGVLHLLGFDHADAEEKDAMWAVQHELLIQLGLGDLRLTE